jgi:hypothetical protein
MTTFKYKTVRCEWQIVIQSVDEYGNPIRESYARDCRATRTVLAIWPTAKEAYADLFNHGTMHKYVKGRWVPNGARSEFECLEVQYREVEVK